ncbi:MAG: hypothetical protein IKR97_04210, partial [Eubacterium sp.]|nr:hypothetical protein [Eubacterium sp.]
MSDLDIDKILEEIRNHSQNEQNQNNLEENGASSAEAPVSDTIDEVMKIVGENEEETAPAENDAKPEENEVVFSLPEEEKKVEETVEDEDFAFAVPPVQEDEEEPAEQSESVSEEAELSEDENEIGQTDLMSLT